MFKRNVAIYTILILCINLILWPNLQLLKYSSDELQVIFLDIGQGDAMLIKTPQNNYGLIDSGPNNNIINALGKYIPSYVSTLDFVILTHPDKDHVEGFIELSKRFKINNLFINKIYKDNGLVTSLKESLEVNRIKQLSLFSVNDFTYDGLNFEIIWPNNNRDLKFLDSNDTSISLLIEYKNLGILTLGDISDTFEESLLEKLKDKDIDILKVSHHGSKTSSSEKFIASIKPKISIISASKDNNYGHPAESVVETLSKSGSLIYKTYENGSIKSIYDGSNLIINEENTTR